MQQETLFEVLRLTFTRQVLNNDGLHGVRCISGAIHLVPGYYPVVINFFENHGGAHLEAQMNGAPLAPVAKLPCYIGLVRDSSTMPWRFMDKSHLDYEDWQAGVGGDGGMYTKTAISPITGLVVDGGEGEILLPGLCRKTPCHYLYFRAIPCPPDDYQPPKGASPNTWPQAMNLPAALNRHSCNNRRPQYDTDLCLAVSDLQKHAEHRLLRCQLQAP